MLTPDELDGLRADLIVSSQPPTRTTSFARWTSTHGVELGRRWASELARHYRR